ncbi:MAG: insulinase family protein [Rhodospirillales bacterium]|nr:insulinase family protein [Rhodospirillales bacterium]
MKLAHRNKLLSILLVAIMGLPAAVPALAGVFNPETFTLANGMQVVVVPNHRVPVVTHMVWYKVGSADEESGKSGIAHIFEHLMFKGTKKYGPGIFSKAVARNGGRENAFTSTDYTAYFQTIALDRLEMLMKMEADRMTNLILNQEQVDSERLVVLEERRSRTDNNPGAILGENVQAALFLNHPYGHPIIGWEHEIRALKLADFRSFYKRWYVPANAILVVAGDITAEKLKPLAEKYYGAIPSRPAVTRKHSQEPPQKAARRVLLKDQRVKEASWNRSYLAPGYISGDTRHAYPLQVLSEILGGGATSRLYRSLVVEKKLMISAGASYSADNLGPSQFAFYASPRPEVSLEKSEQLMDEEITRLLKSGVTHEEVDRAIMHLQNEAIYARDSLRAGARAMGSALAIGRTVEDVEAWPDRIGKVTVQQVNEAARAVFKIEQSVTSLLMPENGNPQKAEVQP